MWRIRSFAIGGWRATRDNRGAAGVEFAILAPFLLLLCFGTAELGRAMYQRHVVIKAVRDATRYLTHVPNPTSATYQTIATNYALRGSASGTAPLLLTDGMGNALVTVSFAVSNTTATGLYGSPKIVTTTATFTFTSALLPSFGLSGSIAMTLTHAERFQGA
jgi:Flp pilus assembly protein TadG